ncbi:uncharacterized protein LY89DRAFT_657758 [Mollisia scopiformis]|uniref:Uncharacterized protein n=1 Tax=Mollisia scopiformis TaxID=149040 RepID=A0A132BCM7_MOLSC|nr:uncharacterized protein LY89DRAFT_657758 [Mollisia scopiformis]KUJ09407.1 hypothetical protein LY89DRAFT_657758 [Mollisia scopiformis]
MPPKRKALASASGNARKSPRTKTAPARFGQDDGKREFKYSDPKSLENKPTFQNLEWYNLHKFIDDPDCQDMPADGELMEPYYDRVSDLGIPVTELGGDKLDKFVDECENRNQDIEGLYIYNDWSGWGVSEVMENMLKEFDAEVKKKDVSPYAKWGFVETFAGYVMEDGFDFLDNENSPSVKEIIDMLGLMTLTVFDVLSEHDLLKPGSEIKNLEIICLIILDFIVKDCGDFEIEWGCEVMRRCDEAGIELEKHVRKQVNIGVEDLQKLRDEYKMKERLDKDWDDEYETFRPNHRGGNKYDLTKMSMVLKRKYSIGPEEEVDETD